MKNILVALAFDEFTHTLADYAAVFAQKFGATVWLTHIAAPEPDFVGYEPGPQYIRDDRAAELRLEHRELQNIAARLTEKGLACHAILVQGPTVETILAEAARIQADMLVVGVQEHGFLYNLFVESISLELFKQTNIPLLAVPLSKIKAAKTPDQH